MSICWDIIIFNKVYRKLCQDILLISQASSRTLRVVLAPKQEAVTEARQEKEQKRNGRERVEWRGRRNRETELKEEFEEKEEKRNTTIMTRNHSFMDVLCKQRTSIKKSVKIPVFLPLPRPLLSSLFFSSDSEN